jgi:diacylglycerol O-acyltransferase / wax synthase
MNAPEAKAELIRTLDEKFVANSIAFDAMIAAAALLVEGGPLRGPDGAIDLAGIRERFEAVTWHVPAMRQRLAPTPLRLTTPAWVPVEHLDIDRHVTLHPTIERDRPDQVQVLTGRLNGPMDPSRPLWDIRLVELDSGRVAIVARYHHVIGDALFGLRIGEVVAGTESSAAVPVVTDAERQALGRPPRTGIGILAIAFREWRGRQDGLPGAWREYWRKPFLRRLRRWGGRVIRPVKNLVLERSGEAERLLVPRHSRYLELDLQPVAKYAYKLGGTVHDLTVAATLKASAADEPGRATVSLLVPISRRTAADADVRNHISMTKVTVPASAPIEELVPAVHEQVQSAVQDRSRRDLGERDWSGYATFVTWGRPQRYFGDAAIESVTGWPAGDPGDDIACLSCSYGTRLTICVTTRATTDIDRVMASIAESFTVPVGVAG